MAQLWFKNKRYGYGWYPATWQGWLVVAVHIGLIAVLAFTIDNSVTPTQLITHFIVPVLLATIVLIIIAYKKGETPHWQWGDKK